MKRLLTAVVGVLMLVSLATPAQADHDNDYYIEESSPWLADVWLQDVQRNYCTDGFTLGNGDGGGDLNQTEIDNMEASVLHQVLEWRTETDITTNWAWFGGCTTSLSFSNWYDSNPANFCENLNAAYPNISSRIDYDDTIDAGDYGETFTCDMDNNGKIDFFWVVIDEDRTWHYYYGSNPAEGEYDLTGLFTHEFGHATGFNGHWPGTSDACEQNPLSSYNDMCTGSTIGFFNGTNSDGRAWRSLGAHDIGEANQNY